GLLVALQQSIAVLRAWMLMHFGTMLNVQWHANAFTHLLGLPLAYFEKRHLGDIVSRFRSIDAIQSTLTAAFVSAMLDGVMASVLVVVLLVYNAQLTWICLGATALYTLCRCLWLRPLREATAEQIVHAARQESHFLETVRGARPIKLCRPRGARRAAWLALREGQVNAGLREQQLRILFQCARGMLYGFENGIDVWRGAALGLDGGFSVGMLVAYLSYTGQF